MILNKLYSNDTRFKTVIFSPGFNVVLGKITDESNLDKDCHNLGKSSLIELLDFMFLKELKNGNFLKNKAFLNHIFFLEISLNSGKYLTIKRSVKHNTKISFKILDTSNINLINETNWDYENLPLSSDSPERNPKHILNRILNFDTLNNYNYRTHLNYFLRSQKDYSDEFHLSKYAGGDSTWKPLLFEMLGFDDTSLKDKYELDKKQQIKEDYINKLESSFQINTKEIDKIKGLIQIKEIQKNEIENSLSKFNFYLNEKNLDKELVYDIEDKISALNSSRYSLEMDIKSLNDSIENDVSFDLDSTMKIFKEVSIYFSDQLKKSYSDLIDFNKTLTTDRNKYVLESLKTKKEELIKVHNDLIALNEKRERILEVLTETDTFKKYKSFEKELISIERDLEKYNSKLENSAIIENETDELTIIKTDISTKKKEIKHQIDFGNELYSKIRNSFSEYVKVILDKPGLLSLSENKLGNVEFKSEIYNDNAEITAESNGFSYKKILCACFDLSILINYSNTSFFKFVYHDGCLEALDPRKKINYLTLINKLCETYNIQYILTLIDSDLPTLEGETYTLPENCNIAVELTDENETTNLFGFNF